MIDRKGLVSIVLPVFNRPDQLLEAVKSIVNQSFRGFGLVVVDDFSTANLEEAKDLVLKEGHEWLRLEENRGPAAARNAGAAVIDSDWICFLDSDDRWLPEKLEAQLAWHRRHQDIRISQVKEQWIRNGREVKRPKHWKQREGDLFADSVQRCSIGPSCVMIRRDLWNESGGFNEFYRACEDYELWLRICRSNPVGLVDGDFLAVKHAGHPDQLSETIPVLDRFRVLALLELLIKGGLSVLQRELVRSGIRKKSDILAKGALKRNKDSAEVFYRSISGQIEAATPDMIAEWVRMLREQLQESGCSY